MEKRIFRIKEVDGVDFTSENKLLQIVDAEIKENQKSGLENKKQVFSYKGNNNFKNEWINLEIPGIALYDTLHFNYRVLPKTLNRYSAIQPQYENQCIRFHLSREFFFS